MANGERDTPRTHGSQPDSLRVLEQFAAASGVSFDRILASRTLGEAVRAIPGKDQSTWARRMVEVGESLNLRIRASEVQLREALQLVAEGIPVAVFRKSAEQADWLLLTQHSGGKVLVSPADQAGGDEWVRVKRLLRMLDLPGSDATLQCVLGQPALACDGASQTAAVLERQDPPTPLSRLLGLIRPDKKDIWSVLVFSVVVGMLALATPIAVEALVNTVAFGRFLQPVIVLAILLGTFLAFSSAIRALLAYIAEIIQRRLFVRVVEDLAYRLPRVQQKALDNAHGPELVNRFFDIVTVQKVAAMLLLETISIVLMTVIGMVVLAFYHPFLLGYDLVLLALIAFTLFVLGRGAVKTAIKESKTKYAVAAWLQELARHTTAFKLHSGNQFALDRADELTAGYLDARRQHFSIIMRQILFALSLQALAATVLLGLGGWLVIQGQLTLGQLVAAELIVMVIVSAFAKLGKHVESFYDLLAAVDKLGQLFDLPVEPHDKLFHLRDDGAAEVSVHAASYYYGDGAILSGTSFQVPPLGRAVIAGPPGSGKSTLVDLLCGLRQPTSGHLELDGIDLRELRPDSLREHVSLARAVEIFRGSIDENVHLNRPEISAMDVREALSMVGLLDEVLQLADGLNTTLQTNGGPLSSSQALRLMLARALVGRPRLLIIDGLLDFLPDGAADELLAHIASEHAPWTLIVISGRTVAREHCSQVLRLLHGGAIEHEECSEITG